MTNVTSTLFWQFDEISFYTGVAEIFYKQHSKRYNASSTKTDAVQLQRIRSSSTLQLVIRRARLSTIIGDRAFPVTGSRLWNSLPPEVTSAPTLTVFRNRLNTSLFLIVSFLTVFGF